MSATASAAATSGPIALRIVAEMLGRSEASMSTLIEEERFPVLTINADTRPVVKVFFEPLRAWLNARASGVEWTVGMLEAEIERARVAVLKKDAGKRERKREKVRPGDGEMGRSGKGVVASAA